MSKVTQLGSSSEDSNPRPILPRATGPIQLLHTLPFIISFTPSAEVCEGAVRSPTTAAPSEARPYGSSVHSSQPAWGRGVSRRAGQGCRGQQQICWASLCQGCHHSTGPRGSSQDLSVLAFAGPNHPSHQQGAWQAGPSSLDVVGGWKSGAEAQERGRDTSMPVPIGQGRSSKPGPPD